MAKKSNNEILNEQTEIKSSTVKVQLKSSTDTKPKPAPSTPVKK
jgi:hypothetical protein